MESRFGYDLDHVRIHTDGHAAASARAVNARAYTMGADIVFDSSEYSPETQSGRQLLAHEIAHVVQQSRGGGNTPAPSANSALERDARAAAAGFASGTHAVSIAGACAPGLARDLPRSLSETLNPGELSPQELETEIMLLTEWLEQQTTASSETAHMSSILQQLQQARAPVDPRHARGLLGEQEMAFRGYRAEEGWALIEGPSGEAGHGVTTSGFDGVAYNVRTGELHILDNKSFSRSGNVSSASAIERNLLRNLENLIGRVESTSAQTLPPRQDVLRLLRQTRAALRGRGRIPGRVQLTVTAAGGQSTGVTARLQRRGIRFRDLSAVEAEPPGTARPRLEGGPAAAPVPDESGPLEATESLPAEIPAPPQASPSGSMDAPTTSESSAPPAESTAPHEAATPAPESAAPTASPDIRESSTIPETPASAPVHEAIEPEIPGAHAAGTMIALGIHQYLVRGLQEAEERRAQAALRRRMPLIEQWRRQGEWVEVEVVMDEPESIEVLGQVTGFTEPGQIARFHALYLNHALTQEALHQPQVAAIEASSSGQVVPSVGETSPPSGRVWRNHPYRLYQPYVDPPSTLSPQASSVSRPVLRPASERHPQLLTRTTIPPGLVDRAIALADFYVTHEPQLQNGGEGPGVVSLGATMREQLVPYDSTREENRRALIEALSLQGLSFSQVQNLMRILSQSP